ncbi:MAG: TonB-dependent receptor [Ignavibacteriaceae bacterium]|nr:TonB-dependent receptor [Ignavibacteriaceae bacterium]
MKKLILTYLLFTVSVFAQQTGKLSGTVVDAATGESLPGVNVILKGTYYGAASNINGRYTIDNISTGAYNVDVSLIGYKTFRFTSIKIESGKTTQLDVNLEETVLTLEQDVVVIGDKPLMDVEETQSKRTVSKDEIDALIVENVQNIVSQQSGVVVNNNNEVHIRGGRTYENAFLLDGVSVQDPIAGTGFGLQLSASAIEEVEVITGGFNAEFGQATSGIVNVKTREGSEKYSGAISYKRDNLGSTESSHVFNIDIIEANLSGPEPITSFLLPALGLDIPGQLNFFTNFYSGFSDGITQGYYKPTAEQLYSTTFGGTRFAPRAENSWFWLFKLSYNYSPTIKFNYSLNQSVSINQNSQSLQSNLEYVEPSPGYQYEFQNILDNANTFSHNNIFHNLGLTHTLNSNTYYEFKFNYFHTNLRSDANGLGYPLYFEPKDIVNFPIQYFNELGDTIGVIPGDGFWDVGNPFTWHDHYLEEFSFRGDITSFFDEMNKFKAGFNLQFQEMQVVDIYKPWVGALGLNNDVYKVHPALGSFYAQDNVNFGGMILNFGLRFDYWFPGKFVDDAVKDTNIVTIPDEIREAYNEDSFSWFGERRFKARISPRLGISHPVSDYQTLFFSYGHFSKWPKPQFVYAKLSPVSAQSSFQKFGNPNLNPETTVAYELGLKTQFTPDDVLTITAYYKDIFDYVSTRTARITSARFATQRFITYVNTDYARSRGVEIEFRKRIGSWFNGTASFSYAIVTGKSSSAEEGVLIARGDLNETIREEFLSWDRPFTAFVYTNFYAQPGSFGFAENILDDWSLFIRAFYQSGKRYTPALFTGSVDEQGRNEYEFKQDERYTDIGDDWFYIDLNFEKYFDLAGMRLSVFVEVNNLLDNQNSIIINPVTGKAYEFGDDVPSSWNDPRFPDLQAPINPYPINPARYLAKRNIKFGFTLRF